MSTTAAPAVPVRAWRPLLLAATLLGLAACSSAPKKGAPPPLAGKPERGAAHRSETHPIASAPATKAGCSAYAPAQEDPNTRGNYTAGGLYLPGVNDSTPDHVPDLDCIAEPQVVDLPLSSVGNKSPYAVLGKQYKVLDRGDSYVERGTASYYGNKFHGRLTSNREVYDMYAFTAAHKTLPLPSFARVTNLDNGQSVIVRVNDRGPFHDGRVIDLSYAAAIKLGITARGTGNVEVRALQPGENNTLYATAPKAPLPAPSAAAAGTSPMDALVVRLPQAATPERMVAASSNAVALAALASAEAAETTNIPRPGVRTTIATGTPARMPGAATPVVATTVATGRPAVRTTVATGVPAPAHTADAGEGPANAVAGTASAAAAAAKPGFVVPASEAWRYHIQSDPKRAPDADEFDAWMKTRGARVATGKPAVLPHEARPDATRADTMGLRPDAKDPPRDTVAAAAPDRATPAKATPAPARTAGGALLQVASFASRENAEKALGQLGAAGIPGAWLSDVTAGGRTLWRLRVPSPNGQDAGLVERIARLGLGKPQFVND